MSAPAQRVDGAIGVALTIVAPDPARAFAITALRVGRDGTATIRATSTARSRAGLVMARVSGSTNELATGRYVRALPCDRPRAECEREIDYRVDLDLDSPTAPRDMRLRLELLVVAGT